MLLKLDGKNLSHDDLFIQSPPEKNFLTAEGRVLKCTEGYEIQARGRGGGLIQMTKNEPSQGGVRAAASSSSLIREFATLPDELFSSFFFPMGQSMLETKHQSLRRETTKEKLILLCFLPSFLPLG